MNERDVSLCALWGSGKWFNINPKCHQYDTDFEAFMYEFSLFTTSNSNACTDTQNLVWIIRAKQNEFKVGLKGQSPSGPRKPLHASHVWKTLLQSSVHYILLNCNIYIYTPHMYGKHYFNRVYIIFCWTAIYIWVLLLSVCTLFFWTYIGES